MKRSTPALARLLVITISIADTRDLNRVTFDSSLLEHLANSPLLSEAYLSDLQDSLAEIGWILARVSHAKFALIRQDAILSWMQVNARKLNVKEDKGPYSGAFRERLVQSQKPSILDLSDEEVVSTYNSVREAL
jgi:hypothetical protein